METNNLENSFDTTDSIKASLNELKQLNKCLFNKRKAVLVQKALEEVDEILFHIREVLQNHDLLKEPYVIPNSNQYSEVTSELLQRLVNSACDQIQIIEVSQFDHTLKVVFDSHRLNKDEDNLLLSEFNEILNMKELEDE